MRGRYRFVIAVVGLVLFPATVPAASLYDGPPPRPGPDLLYEPPAVAPQLTNRGVWKAKPILVSGTTSYRRGEFLYQDFLYDDRGARLRVDPADPKERGNLFSKHNGTYSYPTDPAYASNAADLVELRIKPVRRTTAFRVTLNTLKDPSLVAFSIALGGRDGERAEFPFGANVSAPAELFLTVHPAEHRMVADLQRADGRHLAGLPARVDRRRRQVDVHIPRRLWDPRRSVVRVAAGVGLWDRDAGQYLLPEVSANESTPGGSGGATAPAAFFNVAFRTDEPHPSVTAGTEILTDPAWWRDRAQAHALAARDISPFFANVSFRKLARGGRDDSRVPRSGPMDRIFASHFEVAQGADHSRRCLTAPSNCPGQYQGQLQPYAIYVPRKPPPPGGYGLALQLHSLANGYNQYYGTRYQEQFGERGQGSVVVTPLSRGSDGGYAGYAAADVFEVWADAARHYRLNSESAVITGYSMGGTGSFRLAAQYPDLFARAQPTVADGGTGEELASLRHVPVLMWNNHADELNPAAFQATAQTLDSLGYRYELDAYEPCAHGSCFPILPNHLQLIVNDWYGPAADFLGAARVERNPARVTFVRDPARDQAGLGLVADHAYWLSAIRVREGAARGKVDAVSHGFGLGDPQPSATERGLGTLAGGNLGTLEYTFQKKVWGAPPSRPKENRIDIAVAGIESLTVHPERARIGCDADVRLTSVDGPVAVTLAGCNRTVTGGG